MCTRDVQCSGRWRIGSRPWPACMRRACQPPGRPFGFGRPHTVSLNALTRSDRRHSADFQRRRELRNRRGVGAPLLDAKGQRHAHPALYRCMWRRGVLISYHRELRVLEKEKSKGRPGGTEGPGDQEGDSKGGVASSQLLHSNRMSKLKRKIKSNPYKTGASLLTCRSAPCRRVRQDLPEHALDVTWPDGQHLKSAEVVAMREGACVQKGSPGSRAKGQRCSTNWHGVAVA